MRPVTTSNMEESIADTKPSAKQLYNYVIHVDIIVYRVA